MKKEILVSKKDFGKKNYEFYVAAADIGASNSSFAVIGVVGRKNYDIILKNTCQSKDVDDIPRIFNDLLFEAKELYNVEVNRCCIGGAGPVSRKRGYIKLTNLDLEIDAKQILKNTMLNKVILVNDFEAIGYGLDLLDLNKDTVKLEHVGEDLTTGWTPANVFAVIGAGTGLGMTIVPYNQGNHIHEPLPSEGGHVDFCAYNKFEQELVEFLKKNALEKKEVHPELERVLSAKGKEYIYEFIRSKNIYPETGITNQIDNLDGISKIHEISLNYDRDETCKKTVEVFMNIYARAARTLALISECYAGLFIAGRIALKHIDKFQDKSFMEEFERHDKRNDVLRKIPVYIITNNDVGLYGCCNVAVNFYNIA